MPGFLRSPASVETTDLVSRLREAESDLAAALQRSAPEAELVSPDAVRRRLPDGAVVLSLFSDVEGTLVFTTDREGTRVRQDPATWDEVQAAALAVFRRGQAIAQRGGLILVDTKYEFGRAPDGRVVLIDEVHTPDSSRFWVADTYEARLAAGDEPDNFDKEFLRLWYAARGYRGDGEPPAASEDLVVQVSQRYIACYEKLTGRTFAPGAYPVGERLQAVPLGA